MSADRILIDPQEVTKIFKTIHTNEATSPENMSALLLKTFAEELSSAWPKLFQRSSDTHTVPVLQALRWTMITGQ